MNISLLQNNLKKGVTLVSGISGKNINLPILNNVLIEAKNGVINIISTNLEIAITSTMRGKIEKEGSVTIDSKLFLNYINLLPNEKVDIKQSGTTVEIVCGNFKTKMFGQSSDDYPLIPNIENSNKYTINLSALKNALSQTSFSASTNEMRPEMCGVCFTFNDKEIIIAATDSFRLAEQKILIPTEKMGSIDNYSVIVPLRTISELLKILSNTINQEGDMESVEKVDIEITENQILFKIGQTSVFSRLIMGNFPDYKQIIPNNTETTVIINRTELIRAVKTSSLFSKEEVNDVMIEFLDSKNGVIISSSNQNGENSVKLNAEIQGLPNTLVLNYKYILEGLNSIGGDKIKFEILNSGAPCIIRNIENNGLYLVMPLKQ